MKPKIGKKNSNYIQGIYSILNSKKYKGSLPCIYRSSLELKVFRWFDNNSNVITWGSESVVVPYQSPLDGKLHRYFVDLVAALKDRSGEIKKLLIEIKPHKQTMKPEATKNKKVKTMFEIDKQTIASLKDDTLFHDTNFEYFDYSIGEKDNSSPIQWLRPYEIVPTPNIDLESINPNDVRQGTLGKRTESSLVY